MRMPKGGVSLEEVRSLVLTSLLFDSVTKASIHPLVKTGVEQVLGGSVGAPLVNSFPLVTASKDRLC